MNGERWTLTPKSERNNARIFKRGSVFITDTRKHLCSSQTNTRVNTGIYHRGTVFVGVTCKNKLQDKRIAFIMCSVYAVVKCVCPHLIPERVRRAFLLISSSLVKVIFRRPHLLVNEWSIFNGIWLMAFKSPKSSFLRDLRLFGFFWYFLAYK